MGILRTVHIRDEDVLTEFIDGKISEMEAIRRIMAKGYSIEVAKMRLKKDMEALAS